MKKVLIFSVALNTVLFLVIAGGGVYCYMALQSVKQQISSAQELAELKITNLKTAFADGKAQVLSEYQEIKEKTIYKNIDEIHSNLQFANDLLDVVQTSGGIIINENIAWKDKVVSAAEWAGRARIEAKLLALAYDRQEILSRISSTKFEDDWKIQLDGKKPVRLYDWLSETELVTSTALNKPIQVTALGGRLMGVNATQ
mgnify:CR=1 FL=1